jgi:hypothetical protein
MGRAVKRVYAHLHLGGVGTASPYEANKNRPVTRACNRTPEADILELGEFVAAAQRPRAS